MGRKLPALCVRVKWDTEPRGRPCVNAEECRADRCQETLRKRGRRPVLPNMETLHPSRSARPVTVVAVAAPIARSAIDPVRTHPPSAHPAYQQPSAQILSDPPVLGRTGRTYRLDRDEVPLADQLQLRNLFRDRPPLPGSSRDTLPGPAVRAERAPEIRCQTSRPVQQGLFRITATVCTVHVCAVRCGLRCRSALDAHSTSFSLSRRAIPAILRPASRSTKIHRTCGAVTGSESKHCRRRPYPVPTAQNLAL